MRVIITRPLERALPLAEKLRSLEHEVFLAPMLKIAPVRFELPSVAIQAVLFTSVQGVEASQGADSLKIFPVLAVGGKTAAAARQAGFETVCSAEGDVEALFSLILEKCNPGKGLLLHLSGDQTTGNLAERLTEKGFEAERRTAYEAKAEDTLLPSIIEKLRTGACDVVLFFSTRTAHIFRRLIEQEELAGCLARADAVCLSEGIAEEAGKLPWRKVHVAAAPNEQSLIDLLQGLRK